MWSIDISHHCRDGCEHGAEDDELNATEKKLLCPGETDVALDRILQRIDPRTVQHALLAKQARYEDLTRSRQEIHRRRLR